MAYDAGSAVASYKLDISDVRQRAAELRTIFQGIQQQGAALSRVSSSGGNSAQTQQAAERAILARAAAEARLAQVQNTGKNALQGLIQAEQIYAQALAKVDQSSIAAIRAQSQLQVIQNRIASQAGGGLPVLPRTLEAFGTEAIDQFKSGLLGIVGPAAVAGTALAALGGTVESFKRAFVFKAELDQTTNAITVQLRGVRDSGVVFSQAAAFADKYKLTQQEVNQALQASVGILRTSRSSAGDLLSVLARLQVASPEQGLEGAALAVKELSTGSINSLVTRFEVSRTAANKMKDEIAGGADAVQVLSKYLSDAGIGAESLESRTKGAAGALNDAKKAAEDVAIAQGRLAESAGGVLIVKEVAQVYRGLANLLNGDVRSGLTASATEFVAGRASAEAHALALSKGKTEAEAAAIALRVYQQVLHDTQVQEGLIAPDVQNHTKAIQDQSVALNVNRDALSEEAQKKLESQIASAQLSAQQAQLDIDSRRAAQGLLGAGDQAILLARKYGIATKEAQFLINAQQAISNATALADQRVGERNPSNTQSAAEFNNFSKLARAGQLERDAQAKRDADKAKADAKSLRDAQDALNLSRATNKEQKIRELQRQQAATTDPVEKLRLQAQIEQEKRTGAGRVSAAASTALQLQNVEENSQAAILKAQREGQERLRDQEQDFLLRRTRSKEDEERKIQGLLARGQRAAAARERADFALQQKRDQEDFNIQRQRTLRNNRESTGDITAGAERRQGQIEDRAALRGVKASGSPSIGGGAPPATLGGGGGGGASSGATVIQINVNATTNLDGQAVGNLIFDTIHQRIDETIALDLRSATPPGGNQSAVSGARP